MINYTAKYIKIASGYMGQLVEWPEVVTEGKDLDHLLFHYRSNPFGSGVRRE
jgi:hypothetical protein